MFLIFTLKRDLKQSVTVLALLFILNHLDWTRTLSFGVFFCHLTGLKYFPKKSFVSKNLKSVYLRGIKRAEI